MNHNHDVGDIINVAQKGPPKYYQIEKITRTLFLVKKLPIHLVDHRPLPSGDTAYTFWVDWDQATDFQMPQNWVKGSLTPILCHIMARAQLKGPCWSSNGDLASAV